MRPIPAPRLGDAHGLLRAVSERERMRLDELVTEFPVEELFPPGLENALGRTRQIVSFARAAGLLNEDRGTVELTEIGKRYVRAGDPERPFDVAPAQAEWLRRLLRDKHMTDSIFHGAAVALSLCASCPPDFRASTLDFGRAVSHLGRAGWDNENTFRSQGERYARFLLDMELVDAGRRLTATGQQTRDELTLPIHASLKDLAGQLNPGGLEAAIREGEAEAAAAVEEPAAAEEPAAPEPVAAAPAVEEPAVADDEYEDVGPGAGPSRAAAPLSSAEMPAVAPAKPTPPPDIWDVAAPDDRTRAYTAIPEGAPPPAAAPPAGSAPSPAAAPPAGSAPPPAPSAAAPPRGSAPPADAPAPAATPSPPEAPPPAAAPAGAAPPPVSAPPEAAPVAAPPPVAAPAAAPPPAAAPAGADRLAQAAAAATVASPLPGAGEFVGAGAIRSAAEGLGLRLPTGVYAALASALAEGHVVLLGPPASGKTTLALAIAKAAAQSGRSEGATVVTAGHRWSARDTVGRPGDEEWERGVVTAAAARGRWLVIDELDRARLDRALGELSSFLGGVPVTLPDGESAPPADWRVVATAGSGGLQGSAALVRRFVHVRVPPPAEADLHAAIDAAAGGDPVAAAAAKRLLGARELGRVGAGAYVAAARFAAARNRAEPADERTLAHEALTAHIAPLLPDLDDEGRRRLAALAG